MVKNISSFYDINNCQIIENACAILLAKGKDPVSSIFLRIDYGLEFSGYKKEL